MANRVVNGYYGEIIISDQFKISKSTTKNQLFDLFGKENAFVRDVETGYIHYTVRDIYIGESNYIFVATFYHETINSVSFVFDYSPTDTWNDWSQEKELKKLAKYKIWLTQQIGTKRTYPWGEIGAYFDAKGGSTSIVMRYFKKY